MKKATKNKNLFIRLQTTKAEYFTRREGSGSSRRNSVCGVMHRTRPPVIDEEDIAGMSQDNRHPL
jgi:hypothetical protein